MARSQATWVARAGFGVGGRSAATNWGYVMDPVTLAAAVTPFLLKAVEGMGNKIWEKASDAAADEAAGFGRRLLAKLLHRDGGNTDPAAETDSSVEAAPETRGEVAVIDAVNDLVAAPADEDVLVALRLAVRKLLAADPSLMAEVADLVQREAPRQQAGDRAIQVGGNQSGGVNVTGDKNQITYRRPGQP